MKDLKVGDRVTDGSFLGSGTVTKIIYDETIKYHVLGYMVYFDKTPPYQYNLGENPCFMFSGLFKLNTKDKN